LRRRRFVQLVGASVAASGLPAADGPAHGAKGVKALEGVRPLTSRRGKQCTLMGSLEAVLQYHGEAYDYVELMGLSGAAFRIRIAYPDSDRIMGGRIHPGISVDASIGPHMQAVLDVVGFDREIDAQVFHGENGHRVVAARIEREIDRGRPVIAMNLQGASCWGVIAAYDASVPATDADGEGQGRRYLGRTYYDPPGSGYLPAPRFPWDVYFIRRAGEPLLPEEAARRSIEGAVRLLETEQGTVTGLTAWMGYWRPDYVNGLAAYAAWIEDLQDEEGIAELTPPQFLMYWQGHAWMYDQLHDARRAAAAYLRRIAPRFGDREARLLLEASGRYDDLVEHMTRNWSCFPFSRDGYIEPDTGWWIRVEYEEFLGTQIPSYSGEWTTDTRRRGADLLATLREKDEQALSPLRELAY
jgi:hypothetical protein